MEGRRRGGGGEEGLGKGSKERKKNKEQLGTRKKRTGNNDKRHLGRKKQGIGNKDKEQLGIRKQGTATGLPTKAI